MSISIAMATYNGAAYLQAQLDSLAAQTRLPDELVVCDDGSTDATLEIVHRFAASAPFAVRASVNPVRLGYAKNFERAMAGCSGDLILLSDQDDVWLPAKLARIEEEAAAHPEALLVMNDAELVLGDGTLTGLTKLGQTLALGLGERGFTTGCCMAIRRRDLALLLPVPDADFVHDTWLNQLVLLLDGRQLVPEVLQHYRRHGNNTSAWIASRTEKLGQFDLVAEYAGANTRPFLAERLRQLDLLETRLRTGGEVLSQVPGGEPRRAAALARIGDERAALARRLAVLGTARWRRWWPALCMWAAGGYRYSSGWKSFAKDLIQP